jgi:hypothetical protein
MARVGVGGCDPATAMGIFGEDNGGENEAISDLGSVDA